MRIREHTNGLLLGFSLLALAVGLIARLAGSEAVTRWSWLAAVVVVLASVLVTAVRDLLRRRGGVDLLAVLALLGSVLLGEYLAGVVIAIMLASGRSLEDYAARRARRELSALLARAPRTAHRYRGETLESVPVAEVRAGDRLLIAAGEVVPVDGVLPDQAATLDESALTGESVPVEREAGDQVASGVLNAGGPFELRALAGAEQSTFAGIVRLVKAAQESKAPFVRLADRYAVWFVPAALLVAAAAWLVSGDPVRALAVLVVATPCPLILAAPVAIVSGISRAAKRGILIKNGGTLEALARAQVVMFDKTGTLTTGMARLLGIECRGRHGSGRNTAPGRFPGSGLAACHRRRHSQGSPPPRHGSESAGAGRGNGRPGPDRLRGREAGGPGHPAFVIGEAAVGSWARGVQRRAAYQGAAVVFVAVDGSPAGALILADEIRSDSARALRALRRAGIRRTLMVSGDRRDVAETIAQRIGRRHGAGGAFARRETGGGEGGARRGRDGHGGRRHQRRTGAGRRRCRRRHGSPGGRRLLGGGGRGAAGGPHRSFGGRLVHRPSVAGHRPAERVCRHGIVGCRHAVAAFGFLPPVAGALVQEVIDVAVILNALRALGGRWRAERSHGLSADTAERLKSEHASLLPHLDQLEAVAGQLADLAPARQREVLIGLDETLRRQLLPHEQEDERALYPKVAKLLPGEDPLAAMSRTHREVFHLAGLFSRIVADLPEAGPEPEQLGELTRLLYSLAAILRLHFAQEEEIFEGLAEEAVSPAAKSM